MKALSDAGDTISRVITRSNDTENTLDSKVKLTLTLVPEISIFFRCATMPMVVSMQVPSAVATRSVGLNDSPLPMLSTGASVRRVVPDGACFALQRSWPS